MKRLILCFIYLIFLSVSLRAEKNEGITYRDSILILAESMPSDTCPIGLSSKYGLLSSVFSL